MPPGYELFRLADNYLVVGVADFSQIMQDSVAELTHDGRRYVRGPLESVPTNCGDRYCSMRRYDLAPGESPRPSWEVMCQVDNIIQTVQNLAGSTADNDEIANQLHEAIVGGRVDFEELCELRDILEKAITQ